MIEAMVAISVAVMGLFGVLQLLSNSIAINKTISQRHIASYLAMEGVEITKAIIDWNYDSGNVWNAGLNDGTYEFDVEGGIPTDPGNYNISSDPNASSNTPLNFDSSTGVYSYGSGSPTTFIRSIGIERISSSELKVKSTIDWTVRGNEAKELSIEAHFFDWRPQR